MLFSPFLPTNISATPEGLVGSRTTWSALIPLGEAGHRLFAEHILANAGDEGHRPARARRGHGLIGALAAGGTGELPAEDRFARLWGCAGP